MFIQYVNRYENDLKTEPQPSSMTVGRYVHWLAAAGLSHEVGVMNLREGLEPYRELELIAYVPEESSKANRFAVGSMSFLLGNELGGIHIPHHTQTGERLELTLDIRTGAPNFQLQAPEPFHLVARDAKLH